MDESESAKRGIPGFIAKLYRMISDGEDNMISWTEDGKRFVVADPDAFSKRVLPTYFKHNNFASFVRQLNMYGFHKVPNLQQLRTDTSWEFEHPNFQRNRADLLINVKRKITGDEGESALLKAAPELRKLNADLEILKMRSDALYSDIADIQRDNQMLWNESLQMRERYQQQQQVIERILRFLASLFSNDKNLTAAASGLSLNPQPDNLGQKRRLLITDNEFQNDVKNLFSFNEKQPNTSNLADTQKRIKNAEVNWNNLAQDIDLIKDDFNLDDNFLVDFGNNTTTSSISKPKRQTTEKDAEEDFDISQYLLNTTT